MPTRKSFYGLPAPWNPGYAIPRAVMEEGLQRHAYITAMMPRGTYDRATDGTAGYQIPEYVREERTGRGAFTSAWAPRGGPNVPHTLNRHPVPNIVQKALSGLGDIAEYLLVPPPPPPPPPKHAQQFGRRAAAVVLQQVRQAPPQQRGQMLSKIMRRMDPGLESRTHAEVAKARSQGVPAHRALEVGLGRAMSTGMMAELTKLGKSRSMPSRTSLLGLGMYQELGATLGVIKPEYVTTNTGLPDGAVGSGADRQLLLDGDMLFDYKAGAKIHVTPTNGAITSSRMKWLIDTLRWYMTPAQLGVRPVDAVAAAGYCNQSSHQSHLNRLFGNLVAPNEITCDALVTGGRPFYLWSPPGGGAPWAVVIDNISSSATSPGFDLVLKQWNTEILPSIGRGVKNVAGGIKDAVKTVADKVGDIACGLIQQPGFAQGAAATNPAAGVGVVVAAGMCGPGSVPPPVMPPVVDNSGLMKTLLIGGAALVGISILTKKKKTQP